MKLLNKSKNTLLLDLLFSIFIWSILILINGYEVGLEDSSEFLPYALYLKDRSLFPQDLFIQGMETMGVNERYFYARFVALFIPLLEPSVFILHFLFTILLVLGIIQLTRYFSFERPLSYITVTLPLVILYGMNTGGNEWYYNNFQGASVAKPLCIWALYFYLKRSYYIYIVLSIIATLFQPMVGLHFFILSIGTSVFTYRSLRKEDLQSLAICVLLFLFTGGIFIFKIFLAQRGETLASISSDEFIRIAYYFRLPHHYIPSYFSKKGFIIMTCLFAFGSYYFIKKDKRVFSIFLIILLGIIIYLVGGIYYNNYLIIGSWWFRTTIWVKLLGCIGFVGIIKPYLIKIFFNVSNKFEGMAYLSISIILLFLCINNLTAFHNKQYHFPFLSYSSPEIDICYKIKKKTPKSSIFIQPLDFTALKYFGQRSSYIEYKTIARRKDFLAIWKHRMEEVYSINFKKNIPRNVLLEKAGENFFTIDNRQLIKLKTEGVTHILTQKKYTQLTLKYVCGNSKYSVYEL